jgi:hypothetical protein
MPAGGFQPAFATTTRRRENKSRLKGGCGHD